MRWLRRTFYQWRCAHVRRSWFRNIWGDEIFHSGGQRSVWKCDDCGKYLYESALKWPEPDRP